MSLAGSLVANQGCMNLATLLDSHSYDVQNIAIRSHLRTKYENLFKLRFCSGAP